MLGTIWSTTSPSPSAPAPRLPALPPTAGAAAPLFNRAPPPLPRRCRVFLDKFEHDVAVSFGATLNVLRQLKSVDANLDHHRAGPFANLFTDMDVSF